MRSSDSLCTFSRYCRPSSNCTTTAIQTAVAKLGSQKLNACTAPGYNKHLMQGPSCRISDLANMFWQAYFHKGIVCVLQGAFLKKTRSCVRGEVSQDPNQPTSQSNKQWVANIASRPALEPMTVLQYLQAQRDSADGKTPAPRSHRTLQCFVTRG